MIVSLVFIYKFFFRVLSGYGVRKRKWNENSDADNVYLYSCGFISEAEWANIYIYVYTYVYILIIHKYVCVYTH